MPIGAAMSGVVWIGGGVLTMIMLVMSPPTRAIGAAG